MCEFCIFQKFTPNLEMTIYVLKSGVNPKNHIGRLIMVILFCQHIAPYCQFYCQLIYIHTCDINLDSESGLAGSAGKVTSTVRVSTPITATGIPPKFKFKFLVLFIKKFAENLERKKKYYQGGHVR